MRKTAKERKLIKEKKNAKQVKQTTNNMFINNDNEAINFIKILLVLVLFIVVFTIITDFVINKSEEKKKKSDIQYTYIIVGNILNRAEKSYYVLVENKDDANLASYNSYLNQYKAKEDRLAVYSVDLADGFNTSYKAEAANLNVTDISEIRFSNTTLLKIEDGKITISTDNSEEITNILKEISA